MNDRGDKIVHLARELLRCDAKVGHGPAPTHITFSFKALCLTTILTAFGSSAITQWANETQRPLNRYERIELDALVYYAVHTKGLKENSLRHGMQKTLGIDTFDDMTEHDYIVARRYLQNLAQ